MTKAERAIYEKKRRAELRKWFREEVLAKKSCSKCPESHIACLDFHHRNPKEKDFAVSRAIDRKCSKEKILKEIAKCDILCSNCHRKLHWEERNNVGL